MYWTVHLEGGPRRVNHAAVAVGPYVYSFGGYCTGDNYSLWKAIDCHILDTVSLRWKLCSTVDTKTYDPHNSDIPFQRYGHSVVANGELIYLWGGRNDNCADNLIYCFDTVSRQWLPRPEVRGCIPGARDGHSAVCIDNQMYIFGGYEELNERFSNDIYVLDLKTFVWKYVTVGGTPPSWRDFHSAVAFGKKMYIFGGRSDLSGPNHSEQEMYCNVIMCFDTTDNTWVKPITYGRAPVGRRSHSSFVYKNNIYIFGGFNGLTKSHFNDLYKFDPKTHIWSLVEAMGRHKPCPRRRQCCCVVEDRLFLFGGTSPYKTSVNTRTDLGLRDNSDLYILDFNPSLKTLCILVTLQNDLIQTFLPKSLIMEIQMMTKDNQISRTFPYTG